MKHQALIALLTTVAREYPDDLEGEELQDVPRVAYHIQIALACLGLRPHTQSTICDLGGGVGLFSVGCAALGFKRVILIDDFNDPVNRGVGASVLDLHRRHGVEVASRDVIAEGLGDVLRGGADVITTFDSMEHWHHSPKRLFQEVVASLRSGGTFILGVPNSVNMRKRITIPFGVGKWSQMQDWYDPATFRGHVREPDVDDLRYIANDMGLVDLSIFGRNWQGHKSQSRAIRFATRILDRPLRLRASLCSDIYLVGKKP
jgi:SAM-dependent methyltransferase